MECEYRRRDKYINNVIKKYHQEYKIDMVIKDIDIYEKLTFQKYINKICVLFRYTFYLLHGQICTL